MRVHPGLLVLLALGLLASSCAGPKQGTGGSGAKVPDVVAVDADSLEEAAEAEVHLAVSQVWAVADGISELGSRLTFTFWAEQGALTLVSYEAPVLGGVPGRALLGDETRETLRTVLSSYARRQMGRLQVRMQRQAAGWTVDYVSLPSGTRPIEAKRLPVCWQAPPSVRMEGFERLLRGVDVPSGGSARVELAVLMEDGRVEGWELLGLQRQVGDSKGPSRGVPARVRGETGRVLLPFVQGIGPRTVKVVLALAHHGQDAQATGHVEAAHVERATPYPGLQGDSAAAYRAMHEGILWRWREGVEEGFSWLLERGVQEFAVWYVGGILAKGTAFLVERGGGVILRSLKPGGETAAGWLRTMMARLSGAEKRAFEKSWAKVQLEGVEALTKMEAQELRAVMARIEGLAKAPLTTGEKEKIRALAREYYKQFRPEHAEVLDALGALLPIHHRRPLNYAHLFPHEDINAASNLAMVRQEVHLAINRAWTRFRQARPLPTAEEVNQAARVIDAQFTRWYHRAESALEIPGSIDGAESVAIESINQLFPVLR